MSTIQKFEDLEIWQLARVVCDDIFKIIANTDLKNDYKLKEQINGASGSIMDNIAEGFERDGNKEFTQFLSIAKASCGETRSQLYRISDRKYIDEDTFTDLKDKTLLLGNKIGAFIKYLKNSEFKGSKYK
ncbi:MAG: four helix bundle protein [Flavobacteriales bacterium]|jgi:four helix bundle protein|nr:four helix bundle protein [Flavobacteriales bacterium]